MCSQNMRGKQSKCWSPRNVWDDVSCREKLLLDCSAGSQQTAGILPRNFRVMTKVKLDPLLQFLKALRRVENQVGCHVTLERVVTRRTKEKCTKRLGFQPERGEQRMFGRYCSRCHTKSPTLIQPRQGTAIPLRTRCKETLCRVTVSPGGKGTKR